MHAHCSCHPSLYFIKMIIVIECASHWLLMVLLMVHVSVIVTNRVWRAASNTSTTQSLLCTGTVRSRSRLWCVGESKPGSVNDTVTSYKWNRNLAGKQTNYIRRSSHKVVRHFNWIYLCWSTNPLPTGTEGRYVWHDAEHRLFATEHGFGFNVPEPNFQIGGQILARKFQHGHITTSIQLKA